MVHSFCWSDFFLSYQWVTGVTQTIANASRPVAMIGKPSGLQMLTALICRSYYPCEGFEFWFGVSAWSIFAVVAIGITVAAILLMSFDRVSSVSDNQLSTHRGRFWSWHREVFDKKAVADWAVEKVPIIMIIGRRASVAGWRWRIVATVNRANKKARKIVVGLFNVEAEAQKTVQAIRSTF
jgi:hypothetical protein